MITTLGEMKRRCPLAWAAWMADAAKRREYVSANDGGVVGETTVAMFEGFERGQVPGDVFLHHMASGDGHFLVRRDEDRLALVNSFYPEGVTLDTIMADARRKTLSCHDERAEVSA